MGRNSAWLIGARMLQGITQAVAFVLIARRLGPAAYGPFALVISLRLMVAIVTDFGVLQILTSRLADRPTDPRALLETSLGLRLALAGAGAALFIALGFIASNSGSVHVACIVAASSLVPQAVFVGVQATAQVDLRLDRVAWAIVASGVVAVVSTIAILDVTHSVPALATMLVASNVAAAAMGWAMTPRGRVPLRPRIDREAWMRLLRDAAPVGIAIAITTLYFNIDRVLLARLSTTEEVGLYVSVYRFMQFGVIIPSVLVSSSYAVVAGAAADPARAREIMKRLLAITTSIAPLGLLLLTVSPRDVVGLLYGDAYREAGPALAVLGGALTVGIVSGVLVPSLVAFGEGRRTLYVAGAGLVANLAMNFALIPPHGALGAAWATLGTDVVVAIYAYALLRRRLGASLASPIQVTAGAGAAAAFALGVLCAGGPFPVGILAAVATYGLLTLAATALYPRLRVWPIRT
jgi:O-antigen/teichoic acid export membrane protein